MHVLEEIITVLVTVSEHEPFYNIVQHAKGYTKGSLLSILQRKIYGKPYVWRIHIIYRERDGRSEICQCGAQARPNYILLHIVRIYIYIIVERRV